MRSLMNGLAGLVLLVFLAAPVCAEETLAQQVARQCKVELETFCKDVTPGRGRVLACLYAYSDKLSEPCLHVVLDASEQMKLMGAAISHLKSECGEDLDRFCKDIAPGEGRLLDCLEKNDDQLSQKCKVALKELGLKE